MSPSSISDWASKLVIAHTADSDLEAARSLASELGLLDIAADKGALDNVKVPYILLFESNRVFIMQTGPKAPGPIYASFTDGGVDHRRKFGGGVGQLIAKAVGLNKRSNIHVLDVTAGLGKDAFVLASLGCRVSMVERSPIVHQLLKSALQEAKESEVADILARMDLIYANSIDWLEQQKSGVADVIYLDPMYPTRQKSALVKKEMRAFKDLVGGDLDDGKLLAAALDKAEYRVVVKRPRKAESIEGVKPTYILEGKTTRYDVYSHRSFD